MHSCLERRSYGVGRVAPIPRSSNGRLGQPWAASNHPPYGDRFATFTAVSVHRNRLRRFLLARLQSLPSPPAAQSTSREGRSAARRARLAPPATSMSLLLARRNLDSCLDCPRHRSASKTPPRQAPRRLPARAHCKKLQARHMRKRNHPARPGRAYHPPLAEINRLLPHPGIG
jgi:hypothetical protein